MLNYENPFLITVKSAVPCNDPLCSLPVLVKTIPAPDYGAAFLIYFLDAF